MRLRISIVLISLLFPLTLIPQEIRSLQDTFIEAEYFFMSKDYQDALPFYLELSEKIPDNSNVAYRIGGCYLNITGKKNLAIDYLKAASEKMSAKPEEGTNKELSAPYDALYELGCAYLINYQFDKAKDAFSRFAGTLLEDDHENRAMVEQQIRSCDTAKEMISKPVAYTEENLGPIFNDEKSNFNPVISADGKTFTFMVSLKFYDAVMLSRLVRGEWSPPVNITPELMSDGDMYISCLSSDGKLLLLSRDDDFNSDIYSSTYDGNTWNPCRKLNKNINTKYWESHGFITEDGQRLIFASDRPGGYGGLDLYISKKTGGDWGPAVNLGPEINTPLNEDRPFLINNGKTLFFSSQGHITMGGYDLFKTELQSNNIWSNPKNLGYPLNTPDDNIFFMPSANGKSGYYSIYEEAEGQGNYDIYKITFK
ncbi:MAG: ompA 1 [Bacteroidetes bacterium]|nr:ompA 1 [Bacteroidota bacterium]